ncbi:MAG: serine/threonine protein kinase [Anaerolineae bacterium]|nr:serine/threonine protein kinase [Anaerolineae bacterium]
MGAVYRAWDSRLNVPVALKEMTPQPGIHPDTLAQLRTQFQQEAQILARLSHPHLVRVGDFFEERGNAYLVMDFVEGEELASRIQREGALSENQVLIWAGQILDALAYCHAQGIIHRDIKPQNVIIRPDGRVVLVDFGLVKLWNPDDPRTKTAMRGVGTPEYAPPEQYDTQMGHTDIRSDIYGLGATLYHALTGEAPLTATLRMADPEQFVPVRETVSGVSERTEKTVMKALELARSQRWQSAAEMAQAFGVPVPNWSGQALSQPPAPPPRREKTLKMDKAEGGPSEKKRRSPIWGWSLGCLIVLALLAVLVGGGLVVFGGMGGRLASLFSPGETAATAEPTEMPTSTATATSTSTPTPTDTPTSTPTSTSAPTDTPVPTLVPAPTLLEPEDGTAYYLYPGREIVLVWEGDRLGSGQRFRVIIEDESGAEVSLPADGVVEEMAFRFTVSEVGIELGTYRWTVIVEERIEGKWQRVSRTGEWWTLRFVPPPTPTPTPTNTPAPPPGGGGGGGKPKPTNTPPSGG